MSTNQGIVVLGKGEAAVKDIPVPKCMCECPLAVYCKEVCRDSTFVANPSHPLTSMQYEMTISWLKSRQLL